MTDDKKAPAVSTGVLGGSHMHENLITLVCAEGHEATATAEFVADPAARPLCTACLYETFGLRPKNKFLQQ